MYADTPQMFQSKAWQLSSGKLNTGSSMGTKIAKLRCWILYWSSGWKLSYFSVLILLLAR